jgi:hypothetical protein
MKLLRVSFLSVALAAAAASIAVVPSDAKASVSIAVGFDALVKDADAVAIVSVADASSVWEDGRIATYTRVKVDQGVAGAVPAEIWVRTLGGVVGKIGQLVDGEPVLVPGKQSLLFLRKFTTAGTWEVSARGQGQFPIVLDEATKTKKVIRNAHAGLLLPPKPKAVDETAGALQPQSVTAAGRAANANASVRLAADVLHDRPIADVTSEIAAAWKAAHPAPTK